LLVVAVVHHMVLMQHTHLEVEEQIHTVLDHLLVLDKEVDFLLMEQQHYKILDLVEVEWKEHQAVLPLNLMLAMVVLVLFLSHIQPNK
jgi:hypothetical protein